jgi:predicted dehydrogenase/MoaA/NifB/PqqE/SkfB family radical SAM enzyme
MEAHMYCRGMVASIVRRPDQRAGGGGRGRRSVELYLGRRCELDCPFCGRSEHGASPRDVDRALASGGKRLVVRAAQGDDARLRETIGQARGLGFSEIVVRTHALDTMSPEAAARFAGHGADRVLVPLFSPAPLVHDRIARRREALAHALVGMRALAAAGVGVEIEVPLLAPKLQSPEAIVRLVHRAVPSLAAARFFASPIAAPAALAPPPWDEAAPGLAAAIAACRELGVSAALGGAEGVPLCALRDHPALYGVFRFDPRVQLKPAGGAGYVAACEGCATRGQCPGVSAVYRAAHDGRGLAGYARRPAAMYAQRTAGGPVYTAEHRRAASKVTMLVLRPTVNCNQDCPFCSANETSNNVWSEPGAMLRAIARAARRGLDRVSFSGGEPTLSRDLIHFVSAAHRLGIPKIELVTNAVLLDAPHKAKALVDAGLTHAFVSLHAHDDRLSRQMTQKIGDHPRTVRGVRHLIDAGAIVVVNHVITARNYPYLRQFVEFVRAEFGGRTMISFAFVTPQYKALENNALVPRISDVMPYLRRALYRAVEIQQVVHIGSRQGIPPCLLGEFGAWSDVLDLAPEAASEDAPQKLRAEGCDGCRYTRHCRGLWKPYVAAHGLGELRPIEGPPFTEEELSVIHHAIHPPPWGAPRSFDDVPEVLRDRAAEAVGRADAAAEAERPAPVRALPIFEPQRTRPVRVAMIGSGRQARRLALAARGVAGVSIDAVVSPNAPEADLGDFGHCPSFRDVAEAIDAMRPEGLIIAAATHAHAGLARLALEQGVPALLEKPLARTEAEAEELVRAVAEAGPTARLLPAHNMVFAPGVEALFDSGLAFISYVRRAVRTSDEAPRAWGRASLYETLYHGLSLAGRAAGGGVPEVAQVHFQGDVAPLQIRFRLVYPTAEVDMLLDYSGAIDETSLSARAHADAPPSRSWRRAGRELTVRVDDRDVSPRGGGSDKERMLGHFRDVVLGRERPLVTPAEALDVMRAARRAIEALDAAGAPFDRPNAPKHVANVPTTFGRERPASAR